MIDGVDRIFHVAGVIDFNARDLAPMLAVNELGVRRLYSAAKTVGVERIVHVSSVSTIGGVSDPTRRLTENDFGTGLGIDLPYPQTKLRGEKVALEFIAQGLPVVIVNPTFFAGPGDVHLSSARTIVSFAKGQVWASLTYGGMGYTDVRDVARGVVLAMERGRIGERYILGGHNITILQYHHLLADLLGRRMPWIRFPPWLAVWAADLNNAWHRLRGVESWIQSGDVRMASNYWFYDYTRAQLELNLRCRAPEESLRDTIAWLRNQQIIA
jgi:dihydroflavonol-4-reductase